MKNDALGDYNENEIPHGIVLPVHVDERNEAIADAHGKILFSWTHSPTSTLRGFLKRGAEFFCRLASGDARLHKGRVYALVAEKIEDKGTLVVTFKLVE